MNALWHSPGFSTKTLSTVSKEVVLLGCSLSFKETPPLADGEPTVDRYYENTKN